MSDVTMETIKMDPEKLLRTCLAIAEKVMRGRTKISPELRKNYIFSDDRFLGAFKNRVKKDLTPEDLLGLGALSYKWGLLLSQWADEDAEIEDLDAVTDNLRTNKTFGCKNEVVGDLGGWCEFTS